MNSLIQHDTATTLKITCLDQDNAPISLAGSNVTLQLKLNNHATSEKQMTIVDAAKGIVQYQFSGENGVYDLNEPGMIQYRVQILFPDGSVLTSSQTEQMTILKTL